MDAQLKRGLLDAIVLSVVNTGDSYGYKIMQDALLAVEVTESTLYPILRRLEQQGCLTTYNIEFNSRIRKYYKITAVGVERLEKFKAEWSEVKRMMDYIMGDKMHVNADEASQNDETVERI